MSWGPSNANILLLLSYLTSNLGTRLVLRHYENNKRTPIFRQLISDLIALPNTPVRARWAEYRDENVEEIRAGQQ